MTVSKKLIENVEELRKALNEISVYDFDVYTSMELYYKIANKLNEVIKELMRFEGLVSDEVVEQNEKLIYLLGEGLTNEVIKKINQMVQDGTMDSIINHNVFNSLNNKIDENKEELSSQIKDIKKCNFTIPDILKMCFQYHNKDDVEKILLLKEIGLNTVFLPKSNDWQRDRVELDKFLKLHEEYGICVIPEMKSEILMGENYNNELEFVTFFENYKNIIGYYILDEPVNNAITKENQKLVYDRMKTITSKNLYVAEIPFVNVIDEKGNRFERFKQYYTHESFDKYIVNTYFCHEDNERIKQLVTESILNFKKNSNILTPPKSYIMDLPFYTEEEYGYFPTEEKINAHLEGWKNFYDGNLVVYAFTQSANLVHTLENNSKLREILKSVHSKMLKSSSDERGYFDKGIETYAKSEMSETDFTKLVRILSDGAMLKFIPKNDENSNEAIIIGSNMYDSLAHWYITKNGHAYFGNGISTGEQPSSFNGDIYTKEGLTIGDGGWKLKKYLVATKQIQFGTINGKSSKELTIDCPGVEPGDGVICTPFIAPQLGIIWNAFVSSSNIITVRVTNVTDNTLDIGETLFYCDILKR